MRIHTNDHTNVSFGKLSDPGIWKQSPIATNDIKVKYFTNENLQYIVNHIAEMFGLKHDSIQATVVNKDIRRGWLDLNQNSRMERDEIVFQFTMNAAINVYSRKSYYGKHFMYYTAAQYGYPVVFGIVAHEIGHLINRYSMTSLETQIRGGESILVQTSELDPRWDELCADYLAGIVLAKAVPRLSHEPLIQSLRNSESDDDHPDGFWRVYAIEMGYQWGCNNSPMLASRILTDTRQIRQLLQSFCEVYYKKVYSGVNPTVRSQHSSLSAAFCVPCAIPLGKL